MLAPALQQPPSRPRREMDDFPVAQQHDCDVRCVRQVPAAPQKELPRFDGPRCVRRSAATGHICAGYAIGMDFSPDGEYVISGDGGGNLCIWDWTTTRMYRCAHLTPVNVVVTALQQDEGAHRRVHRRQVEPVRDVQGGHVRLGRPHQVLGLAIHCVRMHRQHQCYLTSQNWSATALSCAPSRACIRQAYCMQTALW